MGVDLEAERRDAVAHAPFFAGPSFIGLAAPESGDPLRGIGFTIPTTPATVPLVGRAGKHASAADLLRRGFGTERAVVCSPMDAWDGATSQGATMDGRDVFSGPADLAAEVRAMQDDCDRVADL